jgi:hypothetical protein
LKGGRINVNGGRDTKVQNVKENIGAKPRGATRKAGATASSVESRLKTAAREAFSLLGGED